MYFGPESDGESFEYVTTLKPFIYSKTYTQNVTIEGQLCFVDEIF